MKYFHVSQEEIDKKLFNIFIGISLGNKLLTPELAKKYVRWAHKNTRENTVVFIADDIDVINWMTFRNMSRTEAEKKVHKKSDGLKKLFDRAICELAREDDDPTYISKVHVLFWSDICNHKYNHLKEILAEEYLTNLGFRNDVLYFVDKYIEMRNTEVSLEDRNKLADYIISELPILLGGISWNDTLYNLLLYPTYVDSGMSPFVLDVRGGKYFNSSKLMLRQLCVLVEDYLVKPDNLSILHNV